MPAVTLLAPVPLEHLRDGAEVCALQGKVAFGSRAWEVFRELDIERNGAPVDVFIYASGDPSSERLEVSWYGRYIGHVEGKNGAHPDGMKFRPPSTGKYPSDNKGHWAVFWEVDQLRELAQEERISTGEFVGHSSGKAYKKNFIPEGPILVVRPT
jgi:hypothetical protein